MAMLVDWSGKQKDDFLQMQFNAQHSYYHQQFSKAQFDIVELESQAVESLAVGRLYVDRRPDELRIIDIALTPEYRDKGIGRQLMQSLIDEASAANKSVNIHVEHNNPAIHLYHSLGFRHIRDEGVYYFMGWNAENSSDSSDSEITDQENTAS